MTRARVNWLALTVVVVLTVGLAWMLPIGTDDETLRQQVRAVCEQYANLDLSGMAQLCRQVGGS